jgi:photosystem II stability/assembly factor-like uncharacterized protein
MSVISRLFASGSASLFCLLAGFTTAIALEGAWTDLNPESPERITSENLLDVDFISASTGLTVGANGTILRTTDRGTTWVAATSGTGETLDGVDFIDAAHATAVGANGTILRSSDGGATWVVQTSGTTQYLSDIHFIDALTGWAVGDTGTVRLTTDGGANWIAGDSRTTLNLNAVSFVNAQKGHVVGDRSMLMQTNDGGGSWIHKPDGKVCYNDHGVMQCNGFLDVHFLDASIGFAVGYAAEPVVMVGGAFFRTLNGGGSWLGPPASVPDYFDVEWMKAIAFGNATEGLILVGGKLAGLPEVGSRAYHTLDAGATWSQVIIPIPGALNALSFGDENTAYAVGHKGTILRWDRGGDTPTENRTWGSIKSIFRN